MKPKLKNIKDPINYETTFDAFSNRINNIFCNIDNKISGKVKKIIDDNVGIIILREICRKGRAHIIGAIKEKV